MLTLELVNSTMSKMLPMTAFLSRGPRLCQTTIRVGITKNSGMSGRHTARSLTRAVRMASDPIAVLDMSVPASGHMVSCSGWLSSASRSLSRPWSGIGIIAAADLLEGKRFFASLFRGASLMSLLIERFVYLGMADRRMVATRELWRLWLRCLGSSLALLGLPGNGWLRIWRVFP